MIALATKEDMKRAIGKADGFAGHHIDEESFVNWWGKMIENGHATVLYRESEGQLKEAIGILLFDNPMTGKKSASISFWHVDFDEPPSLVKGLLFARAYAFLKAMNCHMVFCSPMLTFNFERFHKFLTQQGFRPTEVQYKKEIE